jgi:hypothetical protein
MAEGQPRPPAERALRAGYEPRDLSAGRIALVGIGALTLIALLALVPWGLVSLFGLIAPQRPATAVERAEIAPPEPRLDARPGGTLAEVLARQRDILGRYAWVDEEAGIARIPIEAAMAILAERGAWPDPGGGAGTRLRGPAALPSQPPDGTGRLRDADAPTDDARGPEEGGGAMGARP